MKENKYDSPSFFDQYEKMLRSQLGLEGAGEWHALRTMLPDFEGKKFLIWAVVLDGIAAMRWKTEHNP
jgi:hypothetical protein